MENRTLTCINCPMGCQVNVEYELKDGKPDEATFVITGNSCPRGKTYAVSEMTDPTRMVTGTVSVTGAKSPVVPVKTSVPVAKDKVRDVAKELMGVSVKAPVKLGDVIVKNILNTGSDIIATSDVM